MKELSFIGACREFFGYKPGDTLKEFSAEIKALTAKDREELTAMFPSVGITIKEKA